MAVGESNELARQCKGCKWADWNHFDCYRIETPTAEWANGDCVLYKVEQAPNLQKANEAAKRSVNRVARESAERVAERNKQEDPWEGDGFWGWWARTSPPDRKVKEVLPPGEPCFKGGSKKGRRRKDQLKALRKDVWGEC